MAPSLRVVAADADPAVRQFYTSVLPRLGHEVLVVAGRRKLVEACCTFRPNLIITDLSGIEAVREHHLPTILVAALQDLPRVEQTVAADPSLSCLVKPLRESDLKPAIILALHQFECVHDLRKRVAELRQALEDRKVIERAKGVLIKRLGVDEVDAFRRLRTLASENNLKLAEVARQVIQAEEVFSLLSRVQ